MKLHRIAALLLRHWYVTISSVDRLFDIVFWPVLNLVVWGFASVFVAELTAEQTVLAIFIGGMMLWSLFDRAQKDVSLYLLQDFWDQNVYNLYVTPVTEAELFFSVAAFGLLRSLLSFSLLVVLALAGYGFNILDIGVVLLIPFFIPLLLFGWAIGLLITGIIFQLGSRVSIINWSLPFLLQPVAAVFYPVAILPAWLQAVAYALPLAHAFEGFRAALQGTFAVRDFAVAVALSLGYFAVCYVLFLWFVRRSRKTGFLSKQ